LHLDLIVARLAERAAKERLKVLASRLDARLTAGEPVPDGERDEYEDLVEKVELAARRRIGTKPA
jgi:hypothetical protein